MSSEEKLRELLRDIIEAWDWWQVDTYDRCASVPRDAIEDARKHLAGESNGQT